jgi:hypothetical protein
MKSTKQGEGFFHIYIAVQMLGLRSADISAAGLHHWNFFLSIAYQLKGCVQESGKRQSC